MDGEISPLASRFFNTAGLHLLTSSTVLQRMVWGPSLLNAALEIWPRNRIRTIRAAYAARFNLFIELAMVWSKSKKQLPVGS